MAKETTKFDLSIAFDDTEYLNPQIYLLTNTLKDNIPDDVTLHIVTNRKYGEDKPLTYLMDNIYSKVYYKEKDDELKSRCRYMFNCFDIQTKKDWVVKIELDFIVLENISMLNDLLKDEYDLVIEPENRKIFTDNIEQRLWKNMFKAMGIKCPTHKITFRENNEKGLPLYGTGMVCVKSKHLDTIQKRWKSLTKICEKWIDYNVHPNEVAFTAMALDEEWNTYLYSNIYKYNPIGHWRDGPFPSVKLIDNPVLPEGTMIFDYHRPQWLMHTANKIKSVGDAVCKSSEYIPEEWWKLTNKEFLEK